MNIDNKWPLFKGYLTDFRLGTGSSKTSLQQSTVTSTEQKSVNLQLDAEGRNKHDNKKDKGQKKSSKKETETSSLIVKNENGEGKKINMKLLNLI